jgi:hypothetical protein
MPYVADPVRYTSFKDHVTLQDYEINDGMVSQFDNMARSQLTPLVEFGNVLVSWSGKDATYIHSMTLLHAVFTTCPSPHSHTLQRPLRIPVQRDPPDHA